MQTISAKDIQRQAGKLTRRCLGDEKRMAVRGARAVFNKKVFHNENSIINPDELIIKPSSDTEKYIKDILDKWAGREKIITLMSEDLPVHLNLPVTTYPPDFWLLQVLVLGIHRPFLLLTLYEGDSVDTEPDRNQIKDFSMRCARVLTSLLLNYCLKDFILLPCTLDYHSFDEGSLQKEVDIQASSAADYYGGPLLLWEESYQQICRAVTILATASEVPYFFEDSPDAGEKLLMGDPDSDKFLRLIISHLRSSIPTNTLPQTIYYPEKTEAVKTILLEAAKRLSYCQRVVIVTDDEQVKQCVEKLTDTTHRDYGLDPSWFQCVSVQDAKLNEHMLTTDTGLDSQEMKNTASTAHSDELTVSEQTVPGTHLVKGRPRNLTSAESKADVNDNTANGNTKAEPTGRYRTRNGNKSSEMDPRKENSKAAPSDDHPPDTCVIAIDAPRFPDCPGLRLRVLENQPHSKISPGFRQYAHNLLKSLKNSSNPRRSGRGNSRHLRCDENLHQFVLTTFQPFRHPDLPRVQRCRLCGQDRSLHGRGKPSV